MLELRLFGAGQASYNGQPLDGFPTQQSYLLLCYLLLNPHAHYRERLAAVFWADHPAHTSRKHLSQTLWRLRNSLQSADVPVENYLTITKEKISFNREDPTIYSLDIEKFEETVTRYQDITGQQLAAEQATELEDVVNLYVGDLLEGVYDDWCLYDRERLNLHYLDALGKLMVFHEKHQSYEQGLAAGERILNFDNTRERVHQQMMRLYWLAGNRSAALSQYKRCVQILGEELGVDPMKETTQLYQSMQHNQFNPNIDTVQPSSTALSPLVRSDESLQRLADQSLQRLNNLQKIVDETSEELRSLERLIRATLLGTE
ncbi:MAG: bacterial transcriptional activator domain-containing protein [Chloroflexota bacterium]